MFFLKFINKGKILIVSLIIIIAILSLIISFLWYPCPTYILIKLGIPGLGGAIGAFVAFFLAIYFLSEVEESKYRILKELDLKLLSKTFITELQLVQEKLDETHLKIDPYRSITNNGQNDEAYINKALYDTIYSINFLGKYLEYQNFSVFRQYKSNTNYYQNNDLHKKIIDAYLKLVSCGESFRPKFENFELDLKEKIDVLIFLCLVEQFSYEEICPILDSVIYLLQKEQ